MTSPSQQISDYGVSIWLDDLSKDRLTTGSLQNLMDQHSVVGVTSNPTIFAQAAAGSTSYRSDIARMKAAGKSPEEAVFEIMIGDVQGACDLMRPLYEQTSGLNGRVSLEVSPLLATDTAGTIAQAQDLWNRVNRENLMIKIPATKEGLPAVTEAIAHGISVNVTLIFSISRYSDVIDAYEEGLKRAAAAGKDLSRIFSVASFFVSRVDSAVDKILDSSDHPDAASLRSQAAIANARLAYELFEERTSRDSWKALVAQGAHPQRPLWASTGVKDPALPEDLYVTELIAANVVNTMPEKTLHALEAGSGGRADAITSAYTQAHQVMTGLSACGVNMDAVTTELEIDGVAKFVQSWHELLDTVAVAMDQD